jgi:hypothetical protein
VASSTYAQLLIVMCVVGALSEVVTHNVSFLYFEVSFVSTFHGLPMATSVEQTFINPLQTFTFFLIFSSWVYSGGPG